MPNNTYDFYKHFTNVSVNIVMSNSYSYCRKKIPEIKTVTQYTIALEEAVPELLRGENDQYIVDLLQDAKDHNKWPKKYESYSVDNCSLGRNKATGMLSYIDDKLEVILKLSFMSIIIDTEDVCFKPKNFKKGKLDEDSILRIFRIQEVLKKLKEIKEGTYIKQSK